MLVHVRFDSEEDFLEQDYELEGDELKAFLASEGIGYSGTYYRIKSKIFEDVDGEELSLDVIAKQDISVTE